MAERESYRFDARAVRTGVAGGLVLGGMVFAAGLAYRWISAPVMRDLAGGRWVPSVSACGLVAAALACIYGYARMSAARRVVPTGSAGGQRLSALDIARLERARNQARSDAAAVPVQRWNHDLLAGDDRVPEPQDMTGAES